MSAAPRARGRRRAGGASPTCRTTSCSWARRCSRSCPVLFMVMTALKTDKQYLDDTLGPPWPLSFGNFREALHGGDFFIWLKNSAIMTLGAVIVSTLAAALVRVRDRAHALPRPEPAALGQHRADGRAAGRAADPALRRSTPTSGWSSTYRGVILIYAGLTAPFSVYLLTSFFRTIPDELLESAHGRRRLALPHPLADRAAALGAGAS